MAQDREAVLAPCGYQCGRVDAGEPTEGVVAHACDALCCKGMVRDRHRGDHFGERPEVLAGEPKRTTSSKSSAGAFARTPRARAPREPRVGGRRPLPGTHRNEPRSRPGQGDGRVTGAAKQVPVRLPTHRDPDNGHRRIGDSVDHFCAVVCHLHGRVRSVGLPTCQHPGYPPGCNETAPNRPTHGPARRKRQRQAPSRGAADALPRQGGRKSRTRQQAPHGPAEPPRQSSPPDRLLR